MPSTVHEVLIELFRHRPGLVAEILTSAFAIEMTGWTNAQIMSSDLSELLPTEYRADAVTLLTDADNNPVHAVVVEVQLRRDQRKRRSWPAYVAMLFARMGVPTTLLAVCPDRATATWAATPIKMGPGSVVTPLVLGPDQVPVVADSVQASASPELSVLSALAHGGGPDRHQILGALWGALATIDHEHATMYAWTSLVGSASSCQRRAGGPDEYRYQ